MLWVTICVSMNCLQIPDQFFAEHQTKNPISKHFKSHFGYWTTQLKKVSGLTKDMAIENCWNSKVNEMKWQWMTRVALEFAQVSKETRQIMLEFYSDLLVADPDIPYIIY